MSEIDIQKDADALTLTITARFTAPPERVWQVWADPRKLEHWWGPPGFPATFVDYELTAGADIRYFMTSPEGERFHGWWRVLAVDEPRSLQLEDGFADDAGHPNPDLPTTHMQVTLHPDDQAGTRMVLITTFPSVEAMAQLEGMGMVEGIRLALEQIPAVLAASA